jgi:hypothetical protein
METGTLENGVPLSPKFHGFSAAFFARNFAHRAR